LPGQHVVHDEADGETCGHERGNRHSYGRTRGLHRDEENERRSANPQRQSQEQWVFLFDDHVRLHLT
jgi:hypothetical protein